jgi:RNA polymerase sigma factor (TIGR02999 family)
MIYKRNASPQTTNSFGGTEINQERHAPPTEGKVTHLLAAARQGDANAIANVCSLLYQDLRRLARARLRSHRPLTLLDTTVMVHESFFRLIKIGQVDIADRNHFMAYAARAMRSVMIDFVRRRRTERRGGDHIHVRLDTNIAGSLAAQEDQFVNLSDVLDELARTDPRAAQVVEMRYFAGMVDREIADVLGVTERTVCRDWRKAKMLLHVALRDEGRP